MNDWPYVHRKEIIITYGIHYSSIKTSRTLFYILLYVIPIVFIMPYQVRPLHASRNIDVLVRGKFTLRSPGLHIRSTISWTVIVLPLKHKELEPLSLTSPLKTSHCWWLLKYIQSLIVYFPYFGNTLGTSEPWAYYWRFCSINVGSEVIIYSILVIYRPATILIVKINSK